MGIALKDGIFSDITASVRDIVKNRSFKSEQNSKINWAHMLQLTSERGKSLISLTGLITTEM